MVFNCRSMEASLWLNKNSQNGIVAKDWLSNLCCWEAAVHTPMINSGRKWTLSWWCPSWRMAESLVSADDRGRRVIFLCSSWAQLGPPSDDHALNCSMFVEQVNTQTQFLVDFNGAQGKLNAKVVSPSGTESEAVVQEVQKRWGRCSCLFRKWIGLYWIGCERERSGERERISCSIFFMIMKNWVSASHRSVQGSQVSAGVKGTSIINFIQCLVNSVTNGH